MCDAGFDSLLQFVAKGVEDMIKMINPTREAIGGSIEFCYRLKWRTGMKPNGCDLEVKIKADCGFKILLTK